MGDLDVQACRPPSAAVRRVARRSLLLTRIMRIAIGSDHAGFHHKARIKDILARWGHDVTDFGTSSDESVDYPKFIRPVALAVSLGEYERGIVLGGSGNGEAIVAN